MKAVDKTLHAALEVARKRGLIASNPVRDVENRPGEPEDTEAIAVRPEQLREFFEMAQDDEFFPWFLLMGTRGLRRKECGGLQWNDLHLEELFLRVKRSRVVRSDNSVYETTRSRTKRSDRRIPLDWLLAEVLMNHRCRVDAAREAALKAGEEWTETPYVFVWLRSGGKGQGRGTVHVAGEPVNPRVVSDRFAMYAKKAGLDPRVTLYSLRHSAATQMALRGFHPKASSELLGNSFKIFYDRYVKDMPTIYETQRQNGADLTALMYGDRSEVG
jgi:integrase